MTTQNKILDISISRYRYIDEQENSYNADKDEYSIDHNKFIDHLADEILDIIKTNFEKLDFDFIILELTKLGQCPSLLYDDDGRFAITGEGIQDVVMGDEAQDINISHFVKAEEWKDTPREALSHYLFAE